MGGGHSGPCPRGTARTQESPRLGPLGRMRWATESRTGLLTAGKPGRPERTSQRRCYDCEEFWPRFLEGTRSEPQKPSGIAAKETVARVHLIPHLEMSGSTPFDRGIQRLKSALARAPKTVNNVLAVLNVLLKKAVEWSVIERLSVHIGCCRFPNGQRVFRLRRVQTAGRDRQERMAQAAHLVVLLGGDAGLRCGEIMALEWTDVDLGKRQLCVQRSEWKGHVTVPKGGRLRYVPLTGGLPRALREQPTSAGARVLCHGGRSPSREA